MTVRAMRFCEVSLVASSSQADGATLPLASKPSTARQAAFRERELFFAFGCMGRDPRVKA